MVVFDNAILTLLLWEGAKPPTDPSTSKLVTYCKERMEFLVQQLHKSRDTILIPTPVLSEVLVVTGAKGLDYLYLLQKSSVFRIEPFDSRAAIELAEITRTALRTGYKKEGVDASWAKIKVDRQIVAIAKVAGAHTIYTNDHSLGAFAVKAGLKVMGVHDLALPPDEGQGDLMKLLDDEAALIRQDNEPTPEESQQEPGGPDEETLPPEG